MKAPGWDGFIGKFYQTFKNNITQTLFILSQKIETEGILSNSISGKNYHDTKTRKWHYKKIKLQIKSYHEHTCKNL